MEKIINITESGLREILANTLDELIEKLVLRVEDEELEETANSDEPAEITKSDEAAPSAPAIKPSASGSDRSITTGYIAAVRVDGEGFRIRDQWFKVTGSTRIETDLAKGKKVKIYFSQGENCVFANAVYDATQAPEETAVVEV